MNTTEDIIETSDRSKSEVKRDIELNRSETRAAWRNAKEIWANRNPATVAWRATRSKASDIKERTAVAAEAADEKVRSNIYRSLGIALAAGAVVGLLAFRQGKASKKKRRC